MGRIITELERIYGIRQGNNQHSSNGTNLTQEELAQKIGIDLTTYKRDKKILELIPELQDMVNSGINQHTTIGGFQNLLTPFARCVKFNPPSNLKQGVPFRTSLYTLHRKD